MKNSWESADAFRTYFGFLWSIKELSGTPLNLNFWRTTIELSRIRSTGCMSVFCNQLVHRINLFILNEQGKKLNASEGNEPRKASSPLQFREAINNFVGNLSGKGNTSINTREEISCLLSCMLSCMVYFSLRKNIKRRLFREISKYLFHSSDTEFKLHKSNYEQLLIPYSLSLDTVTMYQKEVRLYQTR